MSVFDSLANKFHLGDSEDDYDDDEDMDDYDDDDEYEDQRGGGIFGGRRNRQRDEEEEEQEPAPRQRNNVRNGGGSQQRSGGQLAPVRRGGMTSGKMQVRIIKPSSFDQARQITDTLLSQRTVLLNLEGLDVNTAQRIVDFASGSCYALHGNFMKISHFIIVITPENVDIAGDITVPGAGNQQEAAAAGILGGAAAQGGMGAQNGANYMNGGSYGGGMNYGNTFRGGEAANY